MVVFIEIEGEDGRPIQIEVDENTQAIVLELQALKKRLGRIATRPLMK